MNELDPIPGWNAPLYVKLWLDDLEALEPLGDAERGRLFTALMEYARTGVTPQLNGNERFLFPMMRGRLDREQEAARKTAEARSIAGKSGGRPKSKESKEKQKKQMLFDESKKSIKEKEKEEIKKESKNIPPKSPQGDAVAVFAGEDGVLLAALKNFGAMRKSIKKPMNDTAWKRLFNRLESMSGGNHALMIALLEQSTEHCWQSVYELKGEASVAQSATAGFQAGSAELEAVAALKRERERRLASADCD